MSESSISRFDADTYKKAREFIDNSSAPGLDEIIKKLEANKGQEKKKIKKSIHRKIETQVKNPEVPKTEAIKKSEANSNLTTTKKSETVTKDTPSKFDTKRMTPQEMEAQIKSSDPIKAKPPRRPEIVTVQVHDAIKMTPQQLEAQVKKSEVTKISTETVETTKTTALEKQRQEYGEFLQKSYGKGNRPAWKKELTEILNDEYASSKLEIGDEIVFNNTPVVGSYISQEFQATRFGDSINAGENKIFIGKVQFKNSQIPIMRVYLDGKLYMATIVGIGKTESKTITGDYNLSNTYISPSYLSGSYDTVTPSGDNRGPALMPDAIRIKDGYFIHQGDASGTSPGCIQVEGHYAHALRKKVQELQAQKKPITLSISPQLYA